MSSPSRPTVQNLSANARQRRKQTSSEPATVPTSWPPGIHPHLPEPMTLPRTTPISPPGPHPPPDQAEDHRSPRAAFRTVPGPLLSLPATNSHCITELDTINGPSHNPTQTEHDDVPIFPSSSRTEAVTRPSPHRHRVSTSVIVNGDSERSSHTPALSPITETPSPPLTPPNTNHVVRNASNTTIGQRLQSGNSSGAIVSISHLI